MNASITVSDGSNLADDATTRGLAIGTWFVHFSLETGVDIVVSPNLSLETETIVFLLLLLLPSPSSSSRVGGRGGGGRRGGGMGGRFSR